MGRPVNITMKIYYLEATPMDHEDDSQPVNNDRVQENDRESFILPLTGEQTPDLSKKNQFICFFLHVE